MLFTFIDLFSGIGGCRLAFERVLGHCVFSSEIDNHARKTYHANFSTHPSGDICKIDLSTIPDHDFLVAGFPCQPFSLSGVSKRKSLNQPHGFDCPDKGQLFFKIIDILQKKKPKGFLLENVKHLKFHNNGSTYQEILKLLKMAGYQYTDTIIDAQAMVPQHRERLYIVGFREDVNVIYEPPSIPYLQPKLKDILEPNVDTKYTLSDKLWNYLQEYKKKQRMKGNGFGFSMADPNGITRTLSARYYKDGAEILIPQDEKNPRKLTPRECARLMGFPDSFKIPVSNTQAYKQFGNSVVVPIVELIAWKMVECLFKNGELSPVTSLLENYQHSKTNYLTGEKPIIQTIHGEAQQTDFTQ